MSIKKHIPSEKQKQSYRGWGKQSKVVDNIVNAIASTKMAKAQLPNSDWSDDSKFKMDIFYSGKIAGLELAYQLIKDFKDLNK